MSPDFMVENQVEPTNLALVMAASRHGHEVDLRDGWGIPVYPVEGGARSVAEAAAVGGLGAKVRIIHSRHDDAGN